MNKKLPVWSVGYSENERITFTLSSTHADKETEGFDWVESSVEIKAGGFFGKAHLFLTLSDIIKFKNQIEVLYNKIEGIAQLKTIEDQVELKIEGEGSGHMKLTGFLKDNVSFGNKLHFEIEFDQSFLPKTISELNSTLAFFESCA